MQITDFLDVTFDLKNGKYYPLKNQTVTHYTSTLSQTIQKSVSQKYLVTNMNLRKRKGDYNKALEKSGFSENIKYYKQGPVKRARTRKVIWFNPPYSSHVKINVGKIFMKLIVKYFPKHNRYYKIFNKNTIKLSYSCIPNMGSIITKHNNKLLFRSLEQQPECVIVETKEAAQWTGTVSKSLSCIRHK